MIQLLGEKKGKGLVISLTCWEYRVQKEHRHTIENVAFTLKSVLLTCSKTSAGVRDYKVQAQTEREVARREVD